MHDGCYELMRETIEAYDRLNNDSILDFRDLNLVYLTSVGTWKQGIESKKKTVTESHLLQDDKEYLSMLWDEIWEKAGKGEYSNYEMDAAGNRSIGLFGTGFFSFQRTTTDDDARNFIRMCIDILPMSDDEDMYSRVDQTLSSSFKGMRAAAASMVLHCLKPCAFPPMNSNMGRKSIFEVLGVSLVKKDSIEFYAKNCRAIKRFRDKNFSYSNYRIFDIAAWSADDYLVEHTPEKYGNWEILNDNSVIATCDQKAMSDHRMEVPAELAWFFGVSGLPTGEKKDLVILFDNYEYDAYIERDGVPPHRFRKELIWNDVLSEELLSAADNERQIGFAFQKKEGNSYIITLVDNESKKAEEWWPNLTEYDPGFSSEQYYALLLDKKVIKKEWLEALYDMYRMPGHLGTCADLQERYGKPYTRYNNYLRSIAGRIYNKTGCLLTKDQNGSKHWPILFQGKEVSNDVSHKGVYCWKMREPVVEAMERIIAGGKFKDKEIINEDNDMENTMIHNDHNMILYGPPGTGKTYTSVIYAVSVCEGRPVEEVKKEPYKEVLMRYNDLRDEGRIAFTTFHQSYGYEEFIEGIKPKLDDENETLGYCIEDGVFKDFCRHASTVNVQTKGGITIKDHPRIWMMILGGPDMTTLKSECFSKNEVRIGWSEVEDGQGEDDEELSWRAKQMLHAFTYEMEPGDVVFIEKDSQSIDAIGVIAGEYEYDKSLGKYPRKRRVEWIAKNIDEDMVQYLPRGKKQLARFTIYSVDYLGTEILSEILKKYIDEDEASTDPDTKPYVFIIDEINRGNISKIFGELITLIEDTKRAGTSEAMEAILPYSGESFSVPNNVYILGTMNTADRSIALMDTALRRRFKFKEMMPDSEVLDSLGVGTIAVGIDELNVARMLDIINERIEFLFDREHTIGHAFFTKLADDPSIETLADIFEKNVIPLLQEYFYEDYEKIQLVLGDNSKEDEFKFILDRSVKVKDIFNGNPDIDLPEKGYTVQHEAFLKLESYKQIGKDL